MKTVLCLWFVVLGIVPSIRAATCPNVDVTQTYRFTATLPSSGCQQSACTYYLGVTKNAYDPNYLDFLMEGSAAGYVAVGFSSTGRMDSSDVIMCGVDPVTGVVGIVDAYNVVGYNSVRDSTQNVCPHTVSFSNGRIVCSFSRLINTGDATQDVVLNGSYYLLQAAVARKPAGSGNTLAPTLHDVTPTASSQRYNVAQYNGSAVSSDTVVPKAALTKVHGILMLIAWPLLGLTGIFFAAWMKPALGPPPMPPKWFTIHRILMLASMFVGAAGFVIIFIANYGINKGLIPLSSNESLAHVGIGIIVMLLHIINPIISAFRCLPTSPRRWIFNIIHGSLIGFAVEILALINCGIGLALFEANGYSSSPGTYRSLGIYVTYVTLLFLLFVFLFALFTGVAIITGGEMGLKLGPALIKPFLEYFIGNKKQEPVLFKNAVSEVPSIPNNTDARLRGKALDSPAPAPAPAPVVTTPPATPIATKPPKSKDVVLRWIGLTMFLCITVLFILIIIVLVAS